MKNRGSNSQLSNTPKTFAKCNSDTEKKISDGWNHRSRKERNGEGCVICSKDHKRIPVARVLLMEMSKLMHSLLSCSFDCMA